MKQIVQRSIFMGSSFSSFLATYLLIGALVISLLFQVDPNQSYFGLESIKFVKYLPLELGWGSAFIFLFFCRRSSPWEVWVVFIFGILVFIGGVFTVVFQGSSLMESFIGRGMVVLLVYPAFQVIKHNKIVTLFKYVWFPTLATSMIISVGIFLWFLGFHFVNQPHVYHTQVILPISVTSCLFFYIRRNFRSLYVFLFFFLLSSGFFLLKNTGFLAALLCFFFLLYAVNYRENQERNFLIAFRGIMVCSFLLFSVSIVSVFSFYSIHEIYSHLPSGSPSVRIATYLNRIEMFLDNPIFGTFFTGSPILTLPTSTGQLTIPSHSDFLDILAFGGLAGMLVFITPFMLTIKKILPIFKENLTKFGSAFIFCFTYVSLSLLNFFFNATWARPEASSMLFISLGILIGLDKGWHKLEGAIFVRKNRRAQ